MKSINKCHKDEKFDKKDFKAFMRETAVQAYKLQKEKEIQKPLCYTSVIDLSSDVDSNKEATAQRKK